MVKKGQFILLKVTEFADYLKTLNVTRTIKLIQQHHTWMPSYKQFKGNNHFEMVEGMKAYHLTQSFSDIAQNLTIFQDGLIMICRPINVAPAGIKGANSYGICIEIVGNFDIGNDIMNEVHRNSILSVDALLCKKFNLTPNTDSIVYHHWYDLDTGIRTNGKGNTKTCPGTNFFGGNTIESANKNFIPLVKNKLDEINGVKNIVITSTPIITPQHKMVKELEITNDTKCYDGSRYIKTFVKGDFVTAIDEGIVNGRQTYVTSIGSIWKSDAKPKNYPFPYCIDAEIKVSSQLNIRELPNTNCKVIGQFSNGDKITIIDIDSSNEWGKTTKGWINLSYCKIL